MEEKKGLWTEFKEFLLHGNVMAMAVGIIMGGAFMAVVTSLVDDIISPIIGLIFNVDLAALAIKINEELSITYGAFIAAIINFVLIALVVFFMVKAYNKAIEMDKKRRGVVDEDATKVCPFCKSEIAIDATKCPHCTSEVPLEATE